MQTEYSDSYMLLPGCADALRMTRSQAYAHLARHRVTWVWIGGQRAWRLWQVDKLAGLLTENTTPMGLSRCTRDNREDIADE